MENLNFVPLDEHSMVNIDGGNWRLVYLAWELAGAIDEAGRDFIDGWNSCECDEK